MSFWLIAPYATWMVLMLALPSAPWAYAVRTVATLAMLVAAGRKLGPRSVPRATDLLLGLLVGLLVLAIWIAPDGFAWYRRFCVIGDPYAKAQALSLSSPLTWLQLFGSAFVISVAEELFFRKWLIGFGGFGWMVVLFALEHNRPVVAAVCGVLYGLVYLRRGLAAAIVAHATTNLGLGLYVLATGAWAFW